jgi:TP901 family phage tail tape measure protein
MAGKRATVASFDIDISSIKTKLAELKSSLGNADLGAGFTKKFQKEVSVIDKQLADLEKSMPGSGASIAQLTKFGGKIDDVKKNFTKLLSGMEGFKISDKYIQENIAGLQKYVDRLEQARKKMEQLASQKIADPYETKTAKGGTYGISGAVGKAQKKMDAAAREGNQEGVDAAHAEVTSTIKSKMAKAEKVHGKDSDIYKSLQADLDAMDKLKKKYDDFAKKAKPVVDETKTAMRDLSAATADAGKKMGKAMEAPKKTANEAVDATDNARRSVDKWINATDNADKASQSFNRMESSIKRVFSAATLFRVMSRIVRQTVQDFKELDKQFNEIAIVSEYSTQEMWDSFASVNKMAQDFGVETKNVVEVQNLYYHQGKSMAEVNKLTAQTLTLAKITGMDYASATSNLTAVLNAYNIAAKDAVMVTDSIAAMDTNAAISSEELMTALTKTASIAANAGMSLESTEVFLTKMIETTREAPENLGTALKTIIARFGEVKQEIDGEEVELADINRVDTALKSIGISLLDTAGQIRDLDGVFMELSSKWDDLDRNTQRYIATISAGSRQQSRFIAMMENYDRTLELTEIAQDSAGLSSQQLQKAQESLESSINRLKSSFQELTATWFKAGVFKDGIETLNSLLGIINKMPMALQALTVGLSIWILKNKIITPLLVRQRIVMEGLQKQEGEQAIAECLKTAAADGYGTKLTGVIALIKEYLRLNGLLAKSNNEVTTSEVKKDISTNDGVDNSNVIPFPGTEKVPDPNPVDGTPETAGPTKWGKLTKYTKKGGGKGIAKSATEGLTKVFKDITTKIGGFFTTIKTAIVTAIGTTGAAILSAITVALLAILAAFAIWKVAFAASVNDTKNVEKLTKAQEEYNKSLKEYRNLQKNAKKYGELRVKTYKTNEELEEEQQIAEELINEYPHLLDYIDEEGKYHLKNAEAINHELDAKKRLMEQNAQSYTNMKLLYAQQGIYADTSTDAGATMNNIQSYYSALGEDGIKRIRKELDSIGTLDGGSFKALAEAYAKGEKYSFNSKDFSNLFAGQINESEFQVLVETFSETGNIEEALRMSQSYSEEQMKDIINVWTRLNQLSGGLYEQLLTNIGEEVRNIYVQQADLFVNEELKEKGISQEGQNAIKDTYARVAAEKQAINRDYAEADKWNAGGDIVSSFGNAAEIGGAMGMAMGSAFLNPITALGGTALGLVAGGIFGIIDGVTRNWEVLTTDSETLAAEKTQEEMKIFKDNVKEYFSEGENVDKYNAYTEKLQSATLDTIETALTETDLYDKDADGNYITPQEIRLIVSEFKNTTQQELTDFKNTVKGLKVEFTSGASGKWEEEDWAILDQLNISEVKRFQEIFAQMGNESGATFLKAYQTVAGQLTEKQKADFLSMDLTNIDSVIGTFSKLGDTFKEDKALLGELIGAMGGVDAVLFSTIEEGAEKTQKRLESLTKQLESFQKLAAGEGSFEDFSKVLDQKFALGDFTNIKSVTDFIETNKNSWTNEGIKYLDNSGKTATDLALKTGAVEYQVAFETATDLEKLGDKRDKDQELQYQSALQTMLVSRKGMEAALYEEWKANQEGQVKALEKEIEQLNKKKEAYAELVDYIREYDYYQNLNREINELEYEKQSLEFEIEFSTNVETVVQNTKETINNLNNQIAANNAGAQAAEKNMSMYRDSIEKNYSEYIDFDPSGTLMMNQEKMLDLQQRITDAKAAGNEETAAVLEAEKEAIEKTAKAYENSMKTSQDYNKKLQSNFKELDSVLKNTYENHAKAEEKIYEIIKKNEDKQLEAVKKKYEAIKKENDDYLKSLREMVQKERDIRNRKKSEEDVKKKEKRLALMKMDTSGIYAKDIQDLEAELQDDYQSLEDAEIDRQLSLLEEQAEKEAEAYDKDIEFFELSLEKKRESYSNYQKEVNEILMKGSDEATQWIIKNDETYASSTAARQKLLRDEYEKTMTQGVAAQKLIGSSLIEQVQKNLELCKDRAGDFNFAVTEYTNNTTASNERISGTLTTLTGDYKTMTGEVGNLKGAEDKLKEAINNVITKTNDLETVRQKNYQPNIDRINAEIKKWEELAREIKKVRTAENTEGPEKFTVDKNGSRGAVRGIVSSKADDYGYTNGTYQLVGISGNYYIFDIGGENIAVHKWGTNDADEKNRFKDASGNQIRNDSLTEDDISKWFKIHTSIIGYQAYATGGLADYTGPAWLDGTPSKPEMVLNPTQTKSFIQLVDVLDFITSNSMKKIPEQSSKAKAEGDTYNFNIEVSQMASDYDVDKLVNRIEEKIAKASKYRQVTQVTMKR